MLWKKGLVPGLYWVVRRAYTRLLPSLGLYRGLYSWLCYFCSFGPVLLVVWHACVLRRQEDNERTRRRENPGEGQKEERRRQGGQEKTGRRGGGKEGRRKTGERFKFSYCICFLFWSILLTSVLIQFNLFHFIWKGVVFGVIPCLYNGLYATPGSLLAAPPVQPVPPVDPKIKKTYKNYRPKHKINTAKNTK